MCGIIGLFPYRTNLDVNAIAKAVVLRHLFAESMVHMETRGKDASGVALLWDDNEFAVVKQPVAASFFARDDGNWGDDYTNPDCDRANFQWLMKAWFRNYPANPLRQALGHVRQGTKGSEYNPHNNHPIIISNNELGKGGDIGAPTGCLVGVHNGGIKNDDELFKKHSFNRVAQVDSEVIFHLLNKCRDDFSNEKLKEVFDELNGTFAVMAFNPERPSRVACLRDTRPLEAAFIPELGVLVLISEKSFLENSVLSYDRWRVRESRTKYSCIIGDEEHEVGSVEDEFPYITLKWMTAVGSGVFSLDLDTEVTEKTEPDDLIKVSSMYKPAVASTTYYKDTRATSTSTTPSTTTTPAATGSSTTIGQSAVVPPAVPSLPAPTEVRRKKTDPTVIEDLSTYTDDIPEGEGYSGAEEELIDLDVEILEEAVEGVVETTGVSSDDAPVTEDECPYAWSELVSIGKQSLYDRAKSDTGNILLSSIQKISAKELLAKKGIDCVDEEGAVQVLTDMYDLIFPEAFACGFIEGYKTAAVEYEESTLDSGPGEDEDEVLKLKEAVDSLEEKLALLQQEMAREKAINAKLTLSINEQITKKGRATELVGSYKSMVDYFFTAAGIMDSSGAIIDPEKLLLVKKEAAQLLKMRKKAGEKKAS